MSEHSHRHPSHALGGEHDGGDRRPAAGKTTRTERLGPVQRSTAGASQPAPAAASKRDAHSAPPADGDDPFATHLLGTESAGTSQFLKSLDARDIFITPRPLRVEPGRPATITALPLSSEMLPFEATPVPLQCRLTRNGRSVDDTSGEWQPGTTSGPALSLVVPEPGHYRLELHVNVGRPGYRVLKSPVIAQSASEETIAADQADRLHAAAKNQSATGQPAASVETYRDMLSALLAAQRYTSAGDATSYEHASHLVEAVAARLRAIHPALLDRRADRGYSKNAIDLRFGAARDALRGWLLHLYQNASIKPEHHVAAFQQAETEIKLGTGEKVDLSDLQGLDEAAVTSAKAVGIAAAAAVAAPIAIEVVALIGAEASMLQVGARLYTWAAANPQSALLLSEFLVATGLGIADQGPENYFGQIRDNEDLAWAVFQTLKDLADTSPGGGPVPRAPSRPRGGGRPARQPDNMPDETSRQRSDAGAGPEAPDPSSAKPQPPTTASPPKERQAAAPESEPTERRTSPPDTGPERNRHVHEGDIETEPHSPYFGKWNGKGLHTWEALQQVVQRDGYRIKEVTQDPRTGVRRVTVERIGVDPRTGSTVTGSIKKTIYPKDLEPAEIDAAAEAAFQSAKTKAPGTKLDPVGKKPDGSPNIKRDGSPADGFFEATVVAGDPPRNVKIQGWFKQQADGTEVISSHAPAFDKNWPAVDPGDY